MESLGQMLGVGAVLVLFMGTLWWLRKRGLVRVALPIRRASRRLESLDRLALAPQHVLHLVRFHDRALLLAASPGGCVLLEQVPMEHLGTPIREVAQ